MGLLVSVLEGYEMEVIEDSIGMAGAGKVLGGFFAYACFCLLLLMVMVML